MTATEDEIRARSLPVWPGSSARYDPKLLTTIEAPLTPPRSAVMAFLRWVRDKVRRARKQHASS